MAQSVVYADLKFAASPPLAMPSCPAAPDEDDSPYENVLLGTVPAEPSPGRWPRRWRVPMWLLATSLAVLLVLLVVGTVALGTCYWQVTRSLRDASREHAAEQGRLEQELSAREQRLEQTRLELARARAELGRAWRDGNSSRAELQLQDAELGRARRELAELHRDVQRLQGELNSSRSTVASLRACVNTECCPSGWVLYRSKCLFISVERKTWKESHQYCQRQSAQLLLQDDWSSWTMLGNGAEYWIGEGYRGHPDSSENRSWHCPRIFYGEIERVHCLTRLLWICEKLPDVRSTSKTVPPLPAKW
ncbi:B-cell differentiation antigen CD72-like [Amazona ochrocephala]